MHAQLILILHAFVKKVVPIYQSRDGTEGLKNVMKLFCNSKYYDLSYASNETKYTILKTKTVNNIVIFGIFHKK